MKVCEDEFINEVRATTDEIQLKEASTTHRHGKGRLRDKAVFIKVAWNEAQSYVSFIQSIVIFTALIPASLITVNGAIVFFSNLIGIENSFQFPLEISSFVAFMVVICIFVFGILAMRYLGTFRSTQEISTQMSPSTRLIWKKNQEIIQRLKKIEEMLEEKKNAN